MDELNSKLSSAGVTVVPQIFSKLVQAIRKKMVENKEVEILEIAEFKFLKEKCINGNNAINMAAAEAILIIISQEPTLTKSIIADFSSIITTNKCSPNLSYLMNGLLLLELENELITNKSYKCPFNLRLPQHPLILLLNGNCNTWRYIFKQITFTFIRNRNIEDCHKLYKPLFLYILCNPQEGQFAEFKQKLWTFLSQNKSQSTITLLSWMQFESRDGIQTNSDFLTELSSEHLDENLLFLWKCSAILQLLEHQHDPQTLIYNLIKTPINISMPNPGLLILTKAIAVCPSIYLLDLLKLLKMVIKRTSVDRILGETIKASLLSWIISPCILNAEAAALAHELFTMIEEIGKFPLIHSKTHQTFFKKYENFLKTNSEVFLALQICILLESWHNEPDLNKWLLKLEKAPIFAVVKLINFLYGLFLIPFQNSEIILKIFDLILHCIDQQKNLASTTLTLILFKLTNTIEPELHFAFLKALPKMAVIKENLQKIIGTIQALHKGPNSLKTFSTRLMYDLWKFENKCYSHLENFLVTPYSPSEGDRWEFYHTRVHILKELCALKPELYGKEMVAHLSKILNECNSTDGALACALAIDGIAILCKFEIIDAVTTWNTLAPMFENETRIPIIKSLCLWISEIPNLAYIEVYPKLIDDVVEKLWQLQLFNTDKQVWEAALNAMTAFSVEQIVEKMPVEYLDEENLKLRQTGQLIPGNCWVHLMRNCDISSLHLIGDFLIKMVELEIANYLKFVYQVKGTREPVDYSYLPINSVVRGISTFIKSKMLKWKGNIYQEVYLECLRIFSEEYSKPLPPLDWCFLQELVHEPEAKNYCINIASHQVILSGTARRFMVNYIEAIVENHVNEGDVLNIYKNLKFLANSVQPFTLKPFLEITIYESVELYKKGKEERLLTILEHLQETLQNPTIQESNKTVIADIIINIADEAEIFSKLFQDLLKCIILFPRQYISDLTSPKSVKEITTEWLKRAIKIRTKLALNCEKNPMNWLNELIEIGGGFPQVTQFMFSHFIEVFTKHQDNPDCVFWMLEQIGQIQALIAEKSEAKTILFYCDTFILATVIFSGHFIFLENLSNFDDVRRLFPRAIAALLDVNNWSICTNQALEWFHHMIVQSIFPQQYNDIFIQCLQSLRHELEFHKNLKWMKYLNVECL